MVLVIENIVNDNNTVDFKINFDEELRDGSFDEEFLEDVCKKALAGSDGFGNAYIEIEEESYEFDIAFDVAHLLDGKHYDYLAEAIEKVGTKLTCDDLEHLDAYMEYSDDYIEDALDVFENYTYYSGETMGSLASMFANDLFDEYNVPECVTRYFDYDSFENDLEYDFYETCNGVIAREG